MEGLRSLFEYYPVPAYFSTLSILDILCISNVYLFIYLFLNFDK